MLQRLLVFISITLLICVTTFAGTTGKIAGRVIDSETGEPLVGANIFINSLSTGASTDINGYYFILNIPPGEYEVTASYIGYQSLKKANVSVKVDKTTDLDFELATATLEGEEVLVVESRVPNVQRDKTSTMQNIDEKELETLPVNSVSGVLQLQTGVVNSGGLHVRGGRSGEVAFYVDGYRIEDPLFNEQVVEVNNQAIQQMEFLTGTFNAEYGNALSGVVNIVTKENYEKLTGQFTYKRTNLGLGSAGEDLNENYFEGYFNGPLWKGSPLGVLLSAKYTTADNYYYSGNIQEIQDQGGTVFESVEFSQNKPFGYDNYLTLLGKLYFKPFAAGKLTFLYNYSDREWQNYDHLMRFIPDSTYIRNSSSTLLGLNFTHAVSEKLFYEIRVSYYNYDYLRNLKGLNYQDYPVPTFLRFSNSRFYRSLANSAYEDQVTKSFTAKGDMTYQIDRYNLVKAGFDAKFHELDYFYINNPNNPSARFSIDYLEKPFEGAVYLQDKIEFETIILNLGLRYDFYNPKADFVNNPFDPSSTTESKMKSSFSPRVGIAYPVLENTVFHFAYGQFFQRPEFQVMYENLSRTFSNTEPIFGNPNLEPEKTSSYELGLLTNFENTTLQTTFFSKKIENLIGVVWNYDRLPYASYVNEDFAIVKGFEISAKWNNRNIYASANYTYSIAEGSSSSQQERYSGAFDVVGTQSLKYLPLNFDQTHTANAQLSFSFYEDEGPFNFAPFIFENTTFNIITRYGSGLPYTFNPARARYVAERNNSRLPETIFVDLLIRKDFYIDNYYVSIFADIRNLLDRKNVRSVYSATGSPTDSGSLLSGATPDYDQDPTNFFSPRTIYLGVNFGF